MTFVLQAAFGWAALGAIGTGAADARWPAINAITGRETAVAPRVGVARPDRQGDPQRRLPDAIRGTRGRATRVGIPRPPVIGLQARLSASILGSRD